jgi:Domain of unknown function (DUF4190)
MSDFKFSCPACGQHIACDTSNAGMTVACPACQTALVVPQPPAAAPAPAAPHSGLSIAGSQARHTASEASHSAAMMSRTYAQPQAAANPSGARKTSGLAIASLVCSLTGCLGFIPGIICGHLARRNIRRDSSLKGNGLALAGLILSYLTLASIAFSLVFGVSSLMAVFKSPEFKQAVADAQKQQEMQAAHARAKTNAPPSLDSLWNLNLTTAQFPNQAAAGKVHGKDFTVESASAQNGIIILRQGQIALPDLQVMIFTFVKNNQGLAGKNYDISPANSDLTQKNMPHVRLLWREEGSATNKIQIFGKGFAMKLQLGSPDAAGKIPGKIYLCYPDDQHSYVAGSFDIEPTGGAAAAAPQPKKIRKPRTQSTN